MKAGRLVSLGIAVVGGYVLGNKIADKLEEKREINEHVRAGIVAATSATLCYGMGRIKIVSVRKSDPLIAGAGGAGVCYGKKYYETWKAKPKTKREPDHISIDAPKSPSLPAPAAPISTTTIVQAPKVSDWAYITGQLVQAGGTIAGAVLGSKGEVRRLNHYARMAA